MADDQPHDENDEQPVTQRPCCLMAIHHEPESNFCPTCGTRLKAKKELPTFKFQCSKCCASSTYKALPISTETYPFCPNCGLPREGDVRYPDGFMACSRF